MLLLAISAPSLEKKMSVYILCSLSGGFVVRVLCILPTPKQICFQTFSISMWVTFL